MAIPGLNITPERLLTEIRSERGRLDSENNSIRKLVDIALAKKVAMQTGTKGYRDTCVLGMNAIGRANRNRGSLERLATSREASAMFAPSVMSLETLESAYAAACLDANPEAIIRAREEIRKEPGQTLLPPKKSGPSAETQARSEATRQKKSEIAKQSAARVAEVLNRRFRERGF